MKEKSGKHFLLIGVMFCSTVLLASWFLDLFLEHSNRVAGQEVIYL
jgi:hypothetical protein